MERYQLTHRDFVSDQAMREYRITMGPHWFPNDRRAQSEYANLPGNPRFGNASWNMCLTSGEKVIGTISLYDFANIRHSSDLTNNSNLKNLPDWLTEYAYQGDISTIPESRKQGLSSYMISETLKMARSIRKNRVIFGITRSTNTPMRGSITNAGGKFVDEKNCLFVKFSETHRPQVTTSSGGETIKLHFDKDFPPVIQMFYNKQGNLDAATIATSPNTPGNKNAKPTGKIEDLYPNQCIGIINPHLDRRQTEKLINQIYASVGRFKYASLYQMSSKNCETKLTDPTLNGFDQNWVVYQF